MNHRRILSGIHTTIARTQAHGLTEAAPLTPSRTVTQLSPAQLDAAGAGLLPTREVCPCCLGLGDIERHATDNLTTWQSCEECAGRGHYEEIS